MQPARSVRLLGEAHKGVGDLGVRAVVCAQRLHVGRTRDGGARLEAVDRRVGDADLARRLVDAHPGLLAQLP